MPAPSPCTIYSVFCEWMPTSPASHCGWWLCSSPWNEHSCSLLICPHLIKLSPHIWGTGRQLFWVCRILRLHRWSEHGCNAQGGRRHSFLLFFFFFTGKNVHLIFFFFFKWWTSPSKVVLKQASLKWWFSERNSLMFRKDCDGRVWLRGGEGGGPRWVSLE